MMPATAWRTRHGYERAVKVPPSALLEFYSHSAAACAAAQSPAEFNFAAVQ
jgi:hypothetical protein